MKLKSKSLTIAIAVLLCVALICIFATSKLWTTNAVAAVRDVPIEQGAMDNQSIFNSFEDAYLSQLGDTTYFEGIKRLDSKALSTLDFISERDFDSIPEDAKIKYNFSYNKETNIVTLSAKMILPDGTTEIDELTGVGFVNEKGEIDAAMNVDGESILLSEMRNAGMIENCGWFSRLFKKVAKVVTVAAVAVAAVALVVVTVGTAAPAVVAAGIGVTTAVVTTDVATAATIGVYAAFTAAIAAGVLLTAELAEQYYPGIGATESMVNGTRVVTSQWSKTKTKSLARDIVIAETRTNPENPAKYFHVTKYSNVVGVVAIELKGYTSSVMSSNMARESWSSLTGEKPDALSVISAAFPNLPKVHEPHGMPHYHAEEKNGEHAKGRYGDHVVHSFYDGYLVA